MCRSGVLTALCGVGVGALLLAGCPGPQPDTESPSAGAGAKGEPAPAAGGKIVLGSYMCNTGPFATFGQSSTKAMEMAVEELNAKGGVLGKPIELIVEDDQCKPEEAANAAQKLIQQDNVLCVLGEVASSNSLAAAPICQDAQTPMVTPSSTNPAVTQTGDYIFRICFTDDFQGVVMSKYAVEELKAKTAVVFSDVASDYSKGLSKVFRETFTAAGGEILGEESYNQSDRDFRAQLTKFKGLSPDVVYVPGYYGEVALILSQARQLGLKAVFLGGDGFDSPKLVEIAGKAAEGALFSNHYSKDDPNPVVQQFVASFQAKYNEAPDALAACAYDAVRIVAQAIETAGVEDRTALRDALAGITDFDGVTGKITIDENRNARKSATILTIKGGKQTFVKTMAPE
ncbi:MAG: ABC transporter substrate-binding protein [Armatimonadetes bacterium]|nr:ABC transporter substrate-binding protein [Armatimonadota bacterium]